MAREIPTAGDAEAADRGIPQLNARRGGVPATVKIIGLLAVVLAVLGVVGYIAVVKFQDELKTSQRVEETADVTAQLPELDEAKVRAAASQAPLPEEEPDDNRPTPPTPVASTEQAAQGQVVPALTAEEQAEQALRERRRAAPLMAFGSQDESGDGSDAPVTVNATPNPAALAAAALPAWPAPQQGADKAAAANLAESLEGTELEATSAQLLHDPNMTLTQASVIPCVLNTAIDSTVPGMVSCTVSSDVYSTNGRVLLIDRGSRIVGEYRSGSVRQGMSRIFVVWTRVETPKGVTIALNSPAADALGRSGIAGKVNRHFWERFGAGLLLSLVDDALTYAAQRQAASESQADEIQFNNTSQAGRDAASIAVENSIGIPPTLSVAQGAVVNVFVARDLYFGNIYGLRTARR